jgi:rhodanese-related sulfurtransferase
MTQNPFLPPSESQRSPQAVKAMLAAGALLVDVREPEEFAEIRIPGAWNLPSSEIVERWQEVPADQTVVFYCRSGHRSGLGVNILHVGAEYRNLYNLDGGIRAWFAAGLPVDATPADFVSHEAPQFEELGVREAAQRLEQGHVLVDVREEDEFAMGHASGAINIPLSTLPDAMAALRSRGPLMLICDAGIRSDIAAAYLTGQGFGQVANVEPGVIVWHREHLPWTESEP